MSGIFQTVSGDRQEAQEYLFMQKLANGSVTHQEIHDILYPPEETEFIVEELNETEINIGVTPLMMLVARPDNEETICVARSLLEYGASVNTHDNGEGSTPLIMAAQEGKPKLLQFLISQGAFIDAHPTTSRTQVISFAAQHKRTQCVAVLVNAAKEQNKLSILEARSAKGRTPAYIAVEHGVAGMVGVLAKAGADLRCACPVYFAVGETSCESLVDPNDMLPKHFALCAAVRSFVSMFCAKCGENKDATALRKCSRCRMAHYCSAECQKEDWKLHKGICKQVRKGQDMVGNPGADLPNPSSEPYGFKAGFTERDNHKEGYDRETHPVWEYDAGARGKPDWKRYPAVVEEGLESLAKLGSPRYMFRPGAPEASGAYEEPLSRRPPPNVSTRYVYYCDMVERDIYTGAARSVRRNGSKQAPRSEFF